ncbi:MAG: ScpA family protein [bacterium]
MSDQDDIQQQPDSDFLEDEGVEPAQLVEELEENGFRPDSLFQVHVPVYEGPMDLLLYVVRQRSIDLIELPVGQVAQDFLDYVRSNPALDLDGAGEVLLVAAILVRMKVRALLPREEDEELEDLDAIVARDEELEEAYREIVAAARELARSEEVQRDYFPRGNAAGQIEIDPAEQLLKNITLVTLAEAFRDLQNRVDKTPVHQLAMFTLTIEDMSTMLLSRLRHKDGLGFAEIAERLNERLEVVVAFLAILELIRYRRIRIIQDELFGEIWVMRGPHFDAETDAEMRDVDTVEDRARRDKIDEESRVEMESFEAQQREKQEAREARRAALEAEKALKGGDGGGEESKQAEPLVGAEDMADNTLDDESEFQVPQNPEDFEDRDSDETDERDNIEDDR